jgi:hypothetical protein
MRLYKLDDFEGHDTVEKDFYRIINMQNEGLEEAMRDGRGCEVYALFVHLRSSFL